MFMKVYPCMIQIIHFFIRRCIHQFKFDLRRAELALGPALGGVNSEEETLYNHNPTAV